MMRQSRSVPRVPGAGMPERLGCRAVIEAGVLAHRALSSGRTGRVAAVFERSLYAVLDDCWICIGSKELGSGPLHLLCEGMEPRPVFVGQRVAIGDKTILVDDRPFAGFETTSVWMPPSPPAWTLASLRKGLAAVDRVWPFVPIDQRGLAASGKIQPDWSSGVLEAAAPVMAAFRRLIEAGLRGQRCARCDREGIVPLIGLGPGLTPSGDDVIGGALVALACIGRLETRDALWGACCAHLDRTNEISAAHLRSAAMGYAASALHEAIHAVIGGQVDRVKPALAALLRIGHSSGFDALAGALVVLREAERLHYDSAPRHSSAATNARLPQSFRSV